jgi:excisionase family DNA binding protein
MVLSNRTGLVPSHSAKSIRGRQVPRSSNMLLAIADRWLSVDEVASYLGVKRDTLYKWIRRGNMPAHKAGRLWKFRKNEIDEWVYSKDDQSKSRRDHVRTR